MPEGEYFLVVGIEREKEINYTHVFIEIND